MGHCVRVPPCPDTMGHAAINNRVRVPPYKGDTHDEWQNQFEMEMVEWYIP